MADNIVKNICEQLTTKQTSSDLKIDIPDKTSDFILSQWKIKDPRLGSQSVKMVTAYFSIDREIRGNDFYFQRGLQLFKLTPNIKWYFYTNEYEYFSQLDLDNVVLIDCEIKDYFPAQDLLTSDGLVAPTGRDPKKDTTDYLQLINSKLAIMLDDTYKDGEIKSEEDQICWCDFGVIGYIDDKELFAAQLTRISRLDKINKFYSPSFYSDIKPYNLHDKPIWVFAGGFLIGDRSSISKFNEPFIKVVRNSVKFGRITWEVNFWYSVYASNPSLVSLYRCVNHNIHLVEKFLYEGYKE